MCSRHAEEGAGAAFEGQGYNYPEQDAAMTRTPAWDEYWSDDLAPHPDAGRPQGRGERALAPFSVHRQTHYCHHYRQANEHYHSSMRELERCND